MPNSLPNFDREELSQSMTAAMAGRASDKASLEAFIRPSAVKTYAIEVHLPDGASTASRFRTLGDRLGLNTAETADPSVGVLHGPDLTFFVDALDSRFWLLHTTSGATRAQSTLGRAIWTSRDLDWCWFPGLLLSQSVESSSIRWFKSDFRGDDLLPSDGIAARRMRVQFEGDNASVLYEQLSRNPDYGHATALTSIAFPLLDAYLGRTDEVANYRGRFIARGDSFELHVGFVGRVLKQYAELIAAIEERFRISWQGDETGGYTFDGEVLTIDFPRPIPDMDRFMSGLFSCRDPFRLWAVPRSVAPEVYEAEAVDLHIGAQLRMDFTPERLRVYLSDGVCGNSVARLIANLQHRYDASIEGAQASLAN